MSRIAGRRPNASAQISTPGWEPVVGWMNAASQVPSGVLIVDVGLDHRQRRRRRRSGGCGDARRDGHRHEVAPGDAAGVRVGAVVLLLILLVGHRFCSLPRLRGAPILRSSGCSDAHT